MKSTSLRGITEISESKNTEALIDSSKEVGLRINTENKVDVSSPECRSHGNS
jgi:hypothetical protein